MFAWSIDVYETGMGTGKWCYLGFIGRTETRSTQQMRWAPVHTKANIASAKQKKIKGVDLGKVSGK